MLAPGRRRGRPGNVRAKLIERENARKTADAPAKIKLWI